MKKYKNQRGSITLYVLLSMLFFLIVTGASYISIKNKETIQEREISRIKQSYEQSEIISKKNSADDVILPDEYQQVEYIASTGTQYINTNFIPDGNTIVKASYQRNTIDSNRYYLFGCYGSGGNLGRLQFSYGETSFIGYGNAYTDTITNITLNSAIHEIYMEKGSFKIDGEEKYSGSWVDSTTTKQLYLFACNANGSVNETYMGSMRIYNFKIYSGESLVRDFIPCYVKEDNKVGLYDLIEGKFYANDGTGDFERGEKIIDKNLSLAQLRKYKQDGLVMQLDGIINSSTGHSIELSNEWYNIKEGEGKATIKNGCTVGEDYVQLGKGLSQYLQTNLSVFDKSYSIEMVFAPLSFYNYNALWAASNASATREGWTYSDGRLVAGRENGVNGGNCVLKTLGVGEKVNATFVVNETSFYGYINGVKKVNQSTSISTENTTLFFNKRANNGDNRWYSIRVYDRALSDEEVKSNYELDKERFGLE